MTRLLAVALLVGVALLADGRCQAQEPKLRATLEVHTGGVYSVVFSPDGRMMASASWDKTIKLWEVATGKVRTTL
jgi:WD40 repeat protein